MIIELAQSKDKPKIVKLDLMVLCVLTKKVRTMVARITQKNILRQGK